MTTTAAGIEARDRSMVAVFVAASFLGSGLLFLVQPMVARMLLPLAGGTPSLWNTSLVFFQLVLLAGYGFAHLSTRRLGMRLHPLLQIALLAIPVLVLPVSVSDSWRLPGDQSPALWVLAVLALAVGLPFFALSTSSPTLQRWFAATDHPAAANPYFLYAAGNLGSVLALVSYPFVVEPLLSISAQARLWTALYVFFVAASGAAAWLTRQRRTATSVEVTHSPPIAPARRMRWLLWSFVPSALMLGVTRHIGTDVASVPLLWIAPLLLYLSTFIMAFGRVSHRRTALAAGVVRYGVIPLALLFVVNSVSLIAQIAIHLTWFFFAALLAHSRLSEDRPAPDRLTEFYLWISVGGVLGGAFAALLAPVIFSSVLEYPIAIGLAVLLVGSGRARISVPARVAGAFVILMLGLGWLANTQRLHVLAILFAAVGLANAALTLRSARSYAGAVAVALLAVLVIQPAGLLDQQRSFFGVYRVVEKSDGTLQLASGTTNHGTQIYVDGEPALRPASYYHPAGPIGEVIANAAQRRDVGIVGLGVGGLAGYGRPGDTYTFFEIDPTVVEIAWDTDYFTYLSSTPAAVRVVIGDGRLTLEDSPDRYDILVVDAFSSDAIPIHLLTTEAVASYLDRLNEGGALAIHISNRHFALEPVLGRIADELDLYGRARFHHPNEAEKLEGAFASHWVVLARDPRTVQWMSEEWQSLRTGGPLWTDDYSDILRVLKL